MKVVRENSKANFDNLAVGDKYFGHLSGKLCVKSDNTHGVRQEDLKVGYVPPGTTVNLPVVKGRTVCLRDVPAGKTFIRTAAEPSKQFVCLKMSDGTSTRVGTGERFSYSGYDRVELLEGTYSFHGKA